MFAHNEISNSPLPASQDGKLELDPTTCDVLEKSWCVPFRKYVLANMNDEIFKVLYSPRSSRPCVPVNIIMGFLILACFLGKSIKDMACSVLTDLEVRYALDLMTADPKVLASYKPSAILQSSKRFMRRVLGYMSRTNEDILSIFLEDLFAKMAVAAQIHGNLIRMDSMMVASHIKNVSRLELLYITNMIVLKELEKLGYVSDIPEQLLHYLEDGDRNKFLYHDETSKEDKMKTVLKEGTSILGYLSRFKGPTLDTYKVITQVYKEQTDIDDKGNRILRVAGDSAMNSVMIQSPFDVDATFRLKAGKMYKGYVANLVEACGGYGSLIISYSVHQNIFSDEAFMQEFLDFYVDKDKLDKLNTQDEAQETQGKIQDETQDQEQIHTQDQNLNQDRTQDQEQIHTQDQNPSEDRTQDQEQTQDQNLSQDQPQIQEQNQTQTPKQAPKCGAGNFGSVRHANSVLPATDENLEQLIRDTLAGTNGAFRLLAADGGYASGVNFVNCLRRGILLVTTNLTGASTLHFYKDFVFSLDGKVLIKCAGGCSPRSCKYSENTGSCYAQFDRCQCDECRYFNQCSKRKINGGYSIIISQGKKLRALMEFIRGTEEFSDICHFRNGVETLPSTLRRKYGVDHMQARSLVRTWFMFGIRVAGLNVKKFLMCLARIDRGEKVVYFKKCSKKCSSS